MKRVFRSSKQYVQETEFCRENSGLQNRFAFSFGVSRAFILIGLVLICSSTDAVSEPIINNAVAIWLFNEGEGEAVNDGTGHQNHGKLKGEAVWVGGKFGTAVEFDGEDDYVAVPDSPSLNITDEITIVMWAKRNTTSNDDHERAVMKGSKGEPGAYALSIRFARFHFGVHVDERWHFSDREMWRDTDWHHVAGTYDSRTREYNLYKDGVNISKKILDGLRKYKIDTVNADLAIGRWAFGKRYFNGILDEVGIFNKALSEETINELMTNGLEEVLAVAPSGKLAATWGEIKNRQ